MKHTWRTRLSSASMTRLAFIRGSIVAQVALVRATDYDFTALTIALRQALELIGGLPAFIRPGERVLLKISMLRAAPPEQAVTTHPAFAVALAELVREVGATPVIGDSCGGSAYGLSEKALIETGLAELARQHGIETVLFETAGTETVPVPGARYLSTINVSRAARQVDAIISVPKLKTHMETLMTGAVKNMLGCLPGAGKLIVHRTAPSPWDLGQALLDIYSVMRPRLCVMDAIIAMQGNGPSRGEPAAVGALLASADGVALDHVAARLIGYDPLRVPTITPAKERGLGENDAAAIEVRGDSIEQLRPVSFQLCSNTIMRAVPPPLLRLINRFFYVRPAWNDKGCVRCGLCFKSCPVQAMTLADDRITIDRAKCISCFCCHELCPEDGIAAEKSWLHRLLSG